MQRNGEYLVRNILVTANASGQRTHIYSLSVLLLVSTMNSQPISHPRVRGSLHPWFTQNIHGNARFKEPHENTLVSKRIGSRVCTQERTWVGSVALTLRDRRLTRLRLRPAGKLSREKMNLVRVKETAYTAGQWSGC